MSKAVGIAGLRKQKEMQVRVTEIPDPSRPEKMKAKGQQLQQFDVAKTKEQLAIFKQNLENFASKYKKQLQKDPEFRQYFNELCANIGVDPLVSNKGFWGELLGVGDFYYELGVQIIEICMVTRPVNGGLMDLDDALHELRGKRGSSGQKINRKDIEMAVKQLDVLGNGFSIIKIGHKKWLQSVPYELSDDHSTVLSLATKAFYVTTEQLLKELKWDATRCDRVLQSLITEGMAWLDEDDTYQPMELKYWFPTLYFGSKSSSSSNQAADHLAD